VPDDVLVVVVTGVVVVVRVVVVVVRVVVVVTGVVVVVGRVVVGRVVVVDPVVVGRVVVGRVVVVEVPPPHAVPLTVKEVGAALAELFQDPRNPVVTVPPLATVPFHDMLVTVTVDPVWAQVPLQPWLRVWPFVKPKVRFQEVHGSPVLVIATDPWKPPCHWLTTEYVTLHPVAA